MYSIQYNNCPFSVSSMSRMKSLYTSSPKFFTTSVPISNTGLIVKESDDVMIGTIS